MNNAGDTLTQERSQYIDDLSLLQAAHELKSPLALVRQLALGLELLENVDTKEREKLIRQIILTSEKGLRLTTDLTRSNQLQTNVFELEPLNPKQICEEVAHELYPLYKEKGRELRVLGKNRSQLVVANRDLLRRVITNFGDNALHYSMASTPVELYAKQINSGDFVRVGARDFGPTISIDMWRQIQENLGKRPQLLHNRPQSSGLGLYIAGRFASAMNSKLGATRHRNGATFYIDMIASRQLQLL